MSLSNETYNHLAETVTKLAIEIIEGKIFGLGAGDIHQILLQEMAKYRKNMVNLIANQLKKPILYF